LHNRKQITNRKKTDMNDLQIIKQLLNGNYLNKEELKRAKELIKSLELEINERI